MRPAGEPAWVPLVGGSPVRSPAVSRWVADWETWSARPDGAATVARWARRHPCLAGLGSLDEVVSACRADGGVEGELANQRLAAVVAEALEGDTTAHRVALQRVVPPLVRRAARRARRHRLPLDGVLEDLLATAWVVIGEYPLDRRPLKIAANVVLDTEFGVFAEPSRTARNTVPVAPEDLTAVRDRAGYDQREAAIGEPERVLEDLPHLLREAIGHGLATEDARLLAELFLFGMSVAEIAERDGVSRRWVRKRRLRAVRQIAERLGIERDGVLRAGIDRDG
jgi:DNA-directed RNA polymerase specialized sigma24 family protein